MFCVSLAVAKAEIRSHATIRHGHAPVHSHAVVHAPIHHAPVHHAPIHRPLVRRPIVHRPAPYTPPTYKPAPYAPPTYKEPTYEAAPLYAYQYAVADDYSGVNFGQNENRDGYATVGEYRVLLPDCRTQVVKYGTADGNSGNVMEVTYEGTPCPETYKPQQPTSAYKPAPAYHA